MAERYRQLLKNDRQYQIDCPVMLAASALLLDTQTQRVLAQLKMQSIVSTSITAVCVVLECFDPAGSSVLCHEEFWFRDLTIQFAEQFGQKTAIPISNEAVRKFTVHIETVVFADGHTWSATEPRQIMQILPDREPLSALFDPELVDLFAAECEKLSGRNSIVALKKQDHINYCACGATYDNSEEKCPSCGVAFSAYERLSEKPYLEGRLAEYREAQRIATEKAAEEQRIAVERSKANRKRAKKIAVILLPILALSIGLSVFLINRSQSWNYYRAEKQFSSGQYMKAVEILNRLGDYEDASELILQSYYLMGEEQIKAKEYENARDSFKNAANYSDAQQRVLETYYLQGEAFLSQNDFEQAKDSFLLAGSFSDSKERIKEVSYRQGESLLAEEDYSGAITAFVDAGNFEDAKERILEAYYKQGDTFSAHGEYDEAIRAFTLAGYYSDASSRVKELNNEQYLKKGNLLLDSGDYAAAIEMFQCVGELTIILGEYEQDNIQGNGKEAIDWIVLTVNNDNMLLLSKYCLDCYPYNLSWAPVTWETCSLRKWLNTSFFNTAFSKEEQEVIVLSTLINEKNQMWGTRGGNPTRDSVFILSVEEAKSFVTSTTKHTDYAKAQGILKDGNDYFGNSWRLRSIGYDSYHAECAGTDSFDFRYIGGDPVTYSSDAIRPAIWVDLTSAIVLSALQQGINSLE